MLLPPRPMSAGAPPSSLDPRSSRVVVPSAPVAMLNPPLAPPAAAEDEKRPSPPLKMKLLFPYAVNCVFGGMGRTGENLLCAYVGIHYLNVIVNLLSFYTDGEQARFWIPIFRVWVYLGLAAMALMTCVDIGYYLYGLYALKFDPPQQQLAAAAVQLPPPPPEMDMC